MRVLEGLQDPKSEMVRIGGLSLNQTLDVISDWNLRLKGVELKKYDAGVNNIPVPEI